MPARNRSVHVAKLFRRHQGQQYVTYLLRRSYRHGKKVVHETRGNVSHLPDNTALQAEAFKLLDL